jgi:hypothetical protein
MARDYRKEYDRYQGTEEQKKNRALRNKARREMEAKGKVHKGDGKDVHHVGGSPKGHHYAIKDKEDNRSYARTKNAHKKNPRS